ncbi:MAG: hypothetical protein Q4C55_02990 [Eubacterium sp.]|nr:hypothetical protein [Eubacterium sp.]
MKKAKKWLACVLAALMVVSMLPATAFAAGLESGHASLTINKSKVAFAGHNWWVIGDDTNGVYPQEGHITLLLANMGNDFQCRFRNTSDKQTEGYTKYKNNYYNNNSQGMAAWTTPNEYVGSVVHEKITAIADGLPAKEQAFISARNLIGGGTYNKPSADGIAGQGIDNQKLWALSEAEWKKINDNAVRSYETWWWLRSPSPNSGNIAMRSHFSGGALNSDFLDYENNAVRPALSLDLSSVLFTSDAENGKSSAAVGSNLIETKTPTEMLSKIVKFTMKDASQTFKLDKTVTEMGTTLFFSYSDATTGDNQYVSCVLEDETGVKYYGKLADTSNAASGNLSLPLAGVSEGTYTLKIFSEEINDNSHTDFCSEPVTMKVVISGSDITVSEFGDPVQKHEHKWESTWNSDSTHHWHECAAANCPIQDNSQKDGYGAHVYDQKVVDSKYQSSAADCTNAAAYYYSCICGAAGTETFTDGNPAPHKWGDWKSNGNGTHTRTCVNCSASETAPCSGGTATCTAQAICEICHEAYGEKNMNNHTGTEVWVQTETTHKKVYNCCQTVITPEEEHQWENGVCVVCQYPCHHTGGTATCSQLAICERCGSQYGNLDPNNHKAAAEWTQADDKHYHKCEYGCNTHLDEASCSGGEATCTTPAVCEVCNRSYGDVNPDNHTGNLVWTTTATTHIQAYDCCKKIVVAEEKHEWENGICKKCKYVCQHRGGKATSTEKAICEICGEPYGEVDASAQSSPAKTEANSEKKNPITGTDNSQTSDNINLALLLASGSAVTGAFHYSRRKKKTSR